MSIGSGIGLSEGEKDVLLAQQQAMIERLVARISELEALVGKPRKTSRYGYLPQKPKKRIKIQSFPILKKPFHAISDEDYPPTMLREHEQGSVNVFLTVGINGQIDSCVAQGAAKILNETSCKLLSRRARFIPATDKHGNPVAVDLVWQVVWGITKKYDDLSVETDHPIIRKCYTAKQCSM